MPEAGSRRPKATSRLRAVFSRATDRTTRPVSTLSRPRKRRSKALLAFEERPIPLTHDLEELERLCAAARPGVGFAALDLPGPTQYAVELRYDYTFWPDADTAENALARAERACALVTAALPDDARP